MISSSRIHSFRKRLGAFGILIVLAVATLIGIWFTSSVPEQANNTSQRRRAGLPLNRIIDQTSLQSAQQLEKLATTREESRLTRDTLRLTDHEVDLALASALRDAREHPPAETPETKAINESITKADADVTAARAHAQKIVAAIVDAKGSKLDELQDELQLAQAEVVLKEGELDSAKRDLQLAGGDPESRIQRASKQHQTALHNEQGQLILPPFQTASFDVPDNVLAQFRTWNDLRGKKNLLHAAKCQALAAADALKPKREQLSKHIAELETANSTAPQAKSASASDVAAHLRLLDHLAADRKTLSEYDEREQDDQQLAQVYADWKVLVGTRMRACVNAMLHSLLWIIGIVALVLAGNIVVDRISRRIAEDRRRSATTRLLGGFVVQAIGVLLVLMVLFGAPSQVSTIVAFAGAGLTVALKDFIVAFVGWFILMGRNGIRVGDWVEIKGIHGEVVQIGLLRTVLMETGNWTDSGHPTGRRVTFVNSFAIEGHYFNFSTAGQWLWDSIEIVVPAGREPHQITEEIRSLVTRETEENSRLAEREWERASRHHGVHAFSAMPSINVRPTPQGVTLSVRYITRANERYSLRTRLYQEAVELLHSRQSV